MILDVLLSGHHRWPISIMPRFIADMITLFFTDQKLCYLRLSG